MLKQVSREIRRVAAQRAPVAMLLTLASIVLVVAMHQTTLTSLGETLPWNLGDPSLTTWILSWETYALTDDPSSLFAGNMFYPDGESIKYAEIMLPVVPLFGAVSWLSNSPIVAHNVAILGLSVLSLFCTYFLARRLVDPLSATVAAVAFTFSGYVFMHQGHLQLLTIGFLPLAYLSLFRALEKRRLRDGVILGATTAALTTACLYYGAIWFVCLGVVVVVDLARLRRPGRSWWAAMMAAGAVIAALVGPVAWVYADFQAETSLAREVGGLGLNPIDFITPAPGSVLYEDLFNWSSLRQPSGIVEHGFFLGFVVLALFLTSCLLLIKDRGFRRPGHASVRSDYELGLLALSGFVALILAIGPEALGVPMPFRALAEWVPGFSSIRAASRLAVPALLAMCVLAAWALSRLLAGRRPTARFLIVGLAAGLVAIEMLVIPIRATVPESESVRSHLLVQPPGPVVELPMRQASDATFAFIEGPRLLASIGDWRPRFNGYSGGFPSGYFEDISTLMLFPNLEAIDRMDDLGIRFVVLHGGSTEDESSYSTRDLRRILDSLPSGVVATEFGDDWLVDLDPGS